MKSTTTKYSFRWRFWTCW